MPTYEYQCRNCGHKLEEFQKISALPLTDCPVCHKGDTLQKLVSPVGFQLKGTGWYVTDFRDKGKPLPANKTETGAAGSSDSTTGSAGDSKSGSAADSGKSADASSGNSSGTTDKTGN